MPGLIPLMLNPVAAGNRSSVVFSPQQTKRHTRGQSINALSLPIHSPQTTSFSSGPLPVTPERSSLPPPAGTRPPKRLSLSSPTALPVLPYTPEEWRRTIAEVKRQHSNRRYRACFTRCDDILDNLKITVDVEPIYLISLHFYAATAMEMCARQLSAPSIYGASLLQQAREHYDHASCLIRDAEESALSKSRPRLSLLPLSSPQSPSESSSFRAWTSNSGLSSPTPSVCSSEDLNARLLLSHSPSPSNLLAFSRLARKKVSFELPKEDLAMPEPYIRPDSPTLGFDDEYFVTGLARQDLPEIPSGPKSHLANPSRIQADDDEVTPRASVCFFGPDHGLMSSDLDVSRRLFQTGGPANTYCARLSDLRYRVAQHRASLDRIIDTPIGNGIDLLGRSSTPVGDENQALERKVRIERLRKAGWQRKRFDPRRYEALRNAALAELDF